MIFANRRDLSKNVTTFQILKQDVVFRSLCFLTTPVFFFDTSRRKAETETEQYNEVLYANVLITVFFPFGFMFAFDKSLVLLFVRSERMFLGFIRVGWMACD